MQYCQIPGPVQCPERVENKQRCCGQSWSHQHQHSSAPCHAAQHDGAQFSPALQADFGSHQATIDCVSALCTALPNAAGCHPVMACATWNVCGRAGLVLYRVRITKSIF